MRFNVGDRVKVKRYEDMKKDYPGDDVIDNVTFVDDMHKYCGKSAIISEVREPNIYRINICNFAFSDGMLESLDYKAYFCSINDENGVVLEYRGKRRKFMIDDICSHMKDVHDFDDIITEWISDMKYDIDLQIEQEESNRIKVGDIVRVTPETEVCPEAVDWVKENVSGKEFMLAFGRYDMSYFWDIGNFPSCNLRYKVVAMDDHKAYIMAINDKNRAYVVDVNGLYKAEGQYEV